MKIGIVSKESHAKSHLRALRQEGHDVTMLGGGLASIPTSYDVIVCRPASVSHTSFNAVRGAKKAGQETIIANGVSEVLAGVRRLNGGTPPLLLTPADTALEKTGRDVASELATALGLYSHYLHKDEAGPIVEWLASITGGNGLELWKAYRKTHTVDTIRRALYKEAPADLTQAKGWFVPAQGKLAPVGFWVLNKGLMGSTWEKMGLHVTQEAAQAVLDARKEQTRARNLASEKERKAARKAALRSDVRATAQKVRALREKEAEAEAATAARVAKAKEAEVAKAAARAATAAPSRVVAPVPSGDNWADNVRAALEVLLPEMRAANVKKVTVLEDGTVTFERVVITTGSFTVE